MVEVLRVLACLLGGVLWIAPGGVSAQQSEARRPAEPAASRFAPLAVSTRRVSELTARTPAGASSYGWQGDAPFGTSGSPWAVGEPEPIEPFGEPAGGALVGAVVATPMAAASIRWAAIKRGLRGGYGASLWEAMQGLILTSAATLTMAKVTDAPNRELYLGLAVPALGALVSPALGWWRRGRAGASEWRFSRWLIAYRIKKRGGQLRVLGRF